MRILVIDDEVPVANTTALILRAAGYETEIAYRTEAALEIVTTKPVDVVICDIIMPGTNGIELCSRLKKLNPECRVFLFSGQADTAPLIEEARARGCRWELLAKPVNPRELLAKIAALGSDLGDSVAAK